MFLVAIVLVGGLSRLRRVDLGERIIGLCADSIPTPLKIRNAERMNSEPHVWAAKIISATACVWGGQYIDNGWGGGKERKTKLLIGRLLRIICERGEELRSLSLLGNAQEGGGEVNVPCGLRGEILPGVTPGLYFARLGMRRDGP